VSTPALLDWPTVHRSLPWSVVLLLGGGFALAYACKVSSNQLSKQFDAQGTKVGGVTMGWPLRLVTGAPLVVGGPRQFCFILNHRGGALT